MDLPPSSSSLAICYHFKREGMAAREFAPWGICPPLNPLGLALDRWRKQRRSQPWWTRWAFPSLLPLPFETLVDRELCLLEQWWAKEFKGGQGMEAEAEQEHGGGQNACGVLCMPGGWCLIIKCQDSWAGSISCTAWLKEKQPLPPLLPRPLWPQFLVEWCGHGEDPQRRLFPCGHRHLTLSYQDGNCAAAAPQQASMANRLITAPSCSTSLGNWCWGIGLPS